MPSFSRGLEKALHQAMNLARERNHEFATLEHLLLALTDDRETIAVLTGCDVDIDALKIVSDGVNALRSPDRAFLVITHYQRLLDYIVPDYVHVLAGGRIVRSGGSELAHELEKRGYGWVKELEAEQQGARA